MEVYKLPDDIISKIVSYLDIDTRRIIGVYNRIKVHKYLLANHARVSLYTPPPMFEISLRDCFHAFVDLGVYKLCRTNYQHSVYEVVHGANCMIKYTSDTSGVYTYDCLEYIDSEDDDI